MLEDVQQRSRSSRFSVDDGICFCAFLLRYSHHVQDRYCSASVFSNLPLYIGNSDSKAAKRNQEESRIIFLVNPFYLLREKRERKNLRLLPLFYLVIILLNTGNAMAIMTIPNAISMMSSVDICGIPAPSTITFRRASDA